MIHDADEGFVCMPRTGEPFDKQYNENDILLHPSVLSDVGVVPSIHWNFFNDTTNNSCNQPYINDDPISSTQMLHHFLLWSFIRIKRDALDKSIKHYDALQCKFRQIGIYNSADYLRINSRDTLQLLVSGGSNSGMISIGFAPSKSIRFTAASIK